MAGKDANLGRLVYMFLSIRCWNQMFMCDGWETESPLHLPARDDDVRLCDVKRSEEKKKCDEKTAGKEVRFICMQSATGTHIYKPSLRSPRQGGREVSGEPRRTGEEAGWLKLPVGMKKGRYVFSSFCCAFSFLFCEECSQRRTCTYINMVGVGTGFVCSAGFDNLGSSTNIPGFLNQLFTSQNMKMPVERFRFRGYYPAHT